MMIRKTVSCYQIFWTGSTADLRGITHPDSWALRGMKILEGRGYSPVEQCVSARTLRVRGASLHTGRVIRLRAGGAEQRPERSLPADWTGAVALAPKSVVPP